MSAPIGHVYVYRSRKGLMHWTLSAMRPYRTRDGRNIDLGVWSSACRSCGGSFTEMAAPSLRPRSLSTVRCPACRQSRKPKSAALERPTAVEPTPDLASQVLADAVAEIGAGRDGGRYRFNYNAGPGRSEAWAGAVLMRRAGVDRVAARRLLDKLIARQSLGVVEYRNEKRKLMLGVVGAGKNLGPC